MTTVRKLLVALVAGTCLSIAGTSMVPAFSQAPETRIYFSPRGGAERGIVNAISEAQKDIYVAIYSLTNKAIVNALISAHRRGVKVYIKTDAQQSEGASMTRALQALRAAGVNVYVSRLSRTMHHKYAIIDDTILIYGSYNWTQNAEYRNAENLVITRHAGMCKIFLDEFYRIE